MPSLGLGLGELVLMASVAGAIWMFLTRGGAAQGPVFALQEFNESKASTGELIRIRGRRTGLIAFVLTLMGLDASVSLTVSERETEIRFASLYGITTHRVPTRHIASTVAGYWRPVNLVILAVMILLIGMAAVTAGGRQAPLVLVVVIVADLLCLLGYSLGKTIRIGVETTGGATLAIRYKGSFLDGKRVDLEAASRVCRLIGNLGAGYSAPDGRAQHTGADSEQDASMFCGNCGARQPATHIGERCDKCGERLT